MKSVSEGIEVELALQFTDSFEEEILGFCKDVYKRQVSDRKPAETGSRYKTVFINKKSAGIFIPLL